MTPSRESWPLPGLPRVDVARPDDVDSLLADVANGRLPLAGGTDLLVRLAHGDAAAAPLVWTGGVQELAGLVVAAHGIRIGAAATHGRVAADAGIRRAAPALADACGLIGSVQMRTVATLAGNVCNASPAADALPALVVHGGSAILAARDAPPRTMPIEAFVTGPGITALVPGEILRAIELRPLRVAEGSAYRRFTARASMDLAFVGVAARVALDDAGRVAGAGIALGAVGPTVIVAGEAASGLIGRRPDDASLTAAGRVAAGEARPISDLRASAGYRRRLVAVLVADVLATAVSRAA